MNQKWHNYHVISHIHEPSYRSSAVSILETFSTLTHWGRVTHICVGKQTIIGSDNGLSPGRRQAITWTNAGILLIGPFGTNFSEISIKILTFSLTKIRLKVSSAKWRPFCLGLNVLKWEAIVSAIDLYDDVVLHYTFIKGIVSGTTLMIAITGKEQCDMSL